MSKSVRLIFSHTAMASLPHDNEQYGSKDYWDYRYTQESDGGSFDWFKSYSDVSHIIHELIPDKSARILVLGCGNSRLSDEMYDDGYTRITNIDYSAVVIDQMRRRHSTLRPGMECWLL